MAPSLHLAPATARGSHREIDRAVRTVVETVKGKEDLMGVMACGRGDCEHIMCDQLILNGSRYICYSCYEELCRLKSTWSAQLPKGKVEKRIKKFMKSSPGKYHTELVDTDTEFDRLTGG